MCRGNAILEIGSPEIKQNLRQLIIILFDVPEISVVAADSIHWDGMSGIVCLSHIRYPFANCDESAMVSKKPQVGLEPKEKLWARQLHSGKIVRCSECSKRQMLNFERRHLNQISFLSRTRSFRLVKFPGTQHLPFFGTFPLAKFISADVLVETDDFFLTASAYILGDLGSSDVDVIAEPFPLSSVDVASAC